MLTNSLWISRLFAEFLVNRDFCFRMVEAKLRCLTCIVTVIVSWSSGDGDDVAGSREGVPIGPVVLSLIAPWISYTTSLFLRKSCPCCRPCQTLFYDLREEGCWCRLVPDGWILYHLVSTKYLTTSGYTIITPLFISLRMVLPRLLHKSYLNSWKIMT